MSWAETRAFIDDCFAPDYAGARSRFRAAAGDRLAGVYGLDRRGPKGEELTTDTAWIGPRDASGVLLVFSGTHGVEGFCGSGAQVFALRSGVFDDLPPGVAVLLVHAVNPYGFAWLRRVNEDNVDLNRNFMNHAAAPPTDPDGYGLLHAELVPHDPDPAVLDRPMPVTERFVAEHGERAYQEAVFWGQYDHPDGLCYGGAAPAWSRRTVERVVTERLAAARRVAFVDLHTGLGAYGHGEAITDAVPGTPAGDLGAALWGDGLTSPVAATSVSTEMVGTTNMGVAAALPWAVVADNTLEYGTYALPEMLLALRADNWLHLHGDPASDVGRRIKAHIRRAFYPDESDWRELVATRARQVFARAVRGVAA